MFDDDNPRDAAKEAFWGARVMGLSSLRRQNRQHWYVSKQQHDDSVVSTTGNAQGDHVLHWGE